MSGQGAPTEQSRGRYIAVILIPLTIALVIVAGWNHLVDPYALRGYQGIEGFSDQKSASYSQDRLHKTHAVDRLKPEVVLLGTSRVGMGLDPHHPLFAGRETYNFGITGAPMYELWRSFQHIAAVAPVQDVVFGLDFFMFDVDSAAPPTFVEERLRVTASGRLQPSSYIHDLPPTWWSGEATLASFSTVAHSRATAAGKREPAIHFDRGLFSERPFTSSIAEIGHERQFWLREKDFLWHFLVFSYHNERGESRHLQALRSLLRQAHEEQIDLRLMINPIHARMLLVIEQSGLWNDWLQWKRDLARINAETAAEFAAEPFPLMDFATVNTYTNEEVPEPWDTTVAMRWYWEGSHFRKELGDQALWKLYGAGDEQGVPEDFGLPLKHTDIDQHIILLQRQIDAFKAAYPELTKDVGNRYRLLQSLKDGSFDVDSLTPEQRQEIQKEIDRIGGH